MRKKKWQAKAIAVALCVGLAAVPVQSSLSLAYADNAAVPDAKEKGESVDKKEQSKAGQDKGSSGSESVKDADDKTEGGSSESSSNAGDTGTAGDADKGSSDAGGKNDSGSKDDKDDQSNSGKDNQGSKDDQNNADGKDNQNDKNDNADGKDDQNDKNDNKDDQNDKNNSADKGDTSEDSDKGSGAQPDKDEAGSGSTEGSGKEDGKTETESGSASFDGKTDGKSETSSDEEKTDASTDKENADSLTGKTEDSNSLKEEKKEEAVKDEALAEEDETDLTTLVQNYIETGKKPRFDKNVTYTASSYIVIPEKKNISLDLHGATVEMGNSFFLVLGELDLKNANLIYNDTVKNAIQLGNYPNDGLVKPTDKMTEGAELTLTNVQMDAGETGVPVFGKDSKLTINGGKTNISAKYYAVSTQGSKTATLDPQITINAGTFVSEEDVCMYFPAYGGDVTIKGGDISGYRNGVQMCGGSLKITGGTFSSSAGKEITSDAYSDGSIFDGAAVSFVSRPGYAVDKESNNSLIISGGTFTNEANAPIRLYGYRKNGNNQDVPSLELTENQYLETFKITGGTFEGNEGESPVEIRTKKLPKTTEISGGIYTAAVNGDYLAEGYVSAQKEDGLYYVMKEGTVVDDSLDVKEPDVSFDGVGANFKEDETTGEIPDEVRAKAEADAKKVSEEFKNNGAVTGFVPKGLAESLTSKLAAFKKDKGIVSDTEIKMNLSIAWKDSEYEIVENEPKLSMLRFEVTPYYTATVAGTTVEDVLENQYLGNRWITFRLPIPSAVTESYAKVTHQGDVDYYDIEGSGNQKYIEVKATHFSEFVVEFTNRKPSSGSGSGGGSSTTIRNNGTWHQDNVGWWFAKTGGGYPADQWYECYWNGQMKWYHFNAQGYLDAGWFTDKDGATYYLHNQHDNQFGYMYTGWNWIDGKCYYFTPNTIAGGPKQGMLYQNGITPDGYSVNETGAWTVNGAVQTK